MSNSDETVVTVEHADEQTPDPTPTVVVADTGGDNGNDLEIGAALGALTVTVETQGAAIAALSERLDAIAYQQESTEATADLAVSVAVEAAEEVAEAVEAAEEVAEEVAEEAAADEVDELIEPQREHWLWRKPVKVRRGVDA